MSIPDLDIAAIKARNESRRDAWKQAVHIANEFGAPWEWKDPGLHNDIDTLIAHVILLREALKEKERAIRGLVK